MHAALHTSNAKAQVPKCTSVIGEPRYKNSTICASLGLVHLNQHSRVLVTHGWCTDDTWELSVRVPCSNLAIYYNVAGGITDSSVGALANHHGEHKSRRPLHGVGPLSHPLYYLPSFSVRSSN